MNEDMLCPWCKSPPCSDATGAICTTTDWECGSSIGCAHQRQSSACKRIERLRIEVDAMRRWAKAAKNAFDDAMECLHYEKVEGLPAYKTLHADDWERLKNWLGELKSVREAAEKARTM